MFLSGRLCAKCCMKIMLQVKNENIWLQSMWPPCIYLTTIEKDQFTTKKKKKAPLFNLFFFNSVETSKMFLKVLWLMLNSLITENLEY